jgi:hypothetical protein
MKVSGLSKGNGCGDCTPKLGCEMANAKQESHYKLRPCVPERMKVVVRRTRLLTLYRKSLRKIRGTYERCILFHFCN